MTWLYATLLTVLAAAFILTPFMKRAGEAEWQRYQVEQMWLRFHESMQEAQRAMRTFGRAAQVAVDRMAEAFKPFMDQVADSLTEQLLEEGRLVEGQQVAFGSKPLTLRPLAYDEFPEEGGDG